MPTTENTKKNVFYPNSSAKHFSKKKKAKEEKRSCEIICVEANRIKKKKKIQTNLIFLLKIHKIRELI